MKLAAAAAVFLLLCFGAPLLFAADLPFDAFSPHGAHHHSEASGVFASHDGTFGASGHGSTLQPLRRSLDPSRKRVAVNFFGLTRSLTYTHESIQRNLLGPIRHAGYQVSFAQRIAQRSCDTRPLFCTGLLCQRVRPTHRSPTRTSTHNVCVVRCKRAILPVKPCRHRQDAAPSQA